MQLHQPLLGATAIVSLDGKTAVEIINYEGHYPISNRDADGYYFAVRATPTGEVSRLNVMFSGLGLATLSPAGLETPDFGDKEVFFVQIAHAQIGEFLDTNGPPPPTPSGAPALEVPCFSEEIKHLKDRPIAEDEAVEEYIRARLYWSWKFGHDIVTFTTPDVLRLGLDLKHLTRIISLGEQSEWIIHKSDKNHVTLKPLPALLQAERERRKGGPSNRRVIASASHPVFVSETRIQELKEIEHASFDLRRLIALCEELNICSDNDCLHAVAMVTRAIIDHVPPIFKAKSFAEVASSYPGSRSFKDSMGHLSVSARKIGDSHLHVQIRSKEVLPTRTQIDFSRDLDVLLAEIVRILS